MRPYGAVGIVLRSALQRACCLAAHLGMACSTALLRRPVGRGARRARMRMQVILRRVEDSLFLNATRIAQVKDFITRGGSAVLTGRMWEWNSANITWKEELGSGSFGVVRRIEYAKVTLAAKRMDLASKLDSRAELETLAIREFRALHKVMHTNIVQLLGVVLTARCHWGAFVRVSPSRGLS